MRDNTEARVLCDSFRSEIYSVSRAQGRGLVRQSVFELGTADERLTIAMPASKNAAIQFHLSSYAPSATRMENAGVVHGLPLEDSTRVVAGVRPRLSTSF